MILIADSGSTKTAWCVLSDTPKTIFTQGINPFQQEEEQISSVLQYELLPQLLHPEQITDIYFYGAGCTPEKAPLVHHVLRQVVSYSANIQVESDMLGAARGLCGQQPGIVAILGTGSNTCYFDGRTLRAGVPALGYILGDEGSGAYIGKRLIGDILKRQMPDDIRQLFLNETHETVANIIQNVYRAPLPNRYLASFSPFCTRHRDHPAIHALLMDCFQQFFRRNIVPITNDLASSGTFTSKTVHFVGSIALHYRTEITQAAKDYGFNVGTILQSPLEGLIQYHRK
ncbi:MAG: ATPase [Bacteroidales bacterium]|mgnify:CR=1 FL=1|nr:ATPase [Bacteroidales bacterium]